MAFITDEVIVHPVDMAEHGWNTGESVTVTAVARVAGRLAALDSIAKASIALGPMMQAATGASKAGKVHIAPVRPSPAKRIIFAVVGREMPNNGHRVGKFLTRFFGEGEAVAPQRTGVLDAQTLGGRVLSVGSLLRPGTAQVVSYQTSSR